MTNIPDDPAGPAPEPWEASFTDPSGTYLFAEITRGWSGGLIRRRTDTYLDIAFPNVTPDQARQLWRAAQRAGLLQPPPEDMARRTSTLHYVRDLARYYVHIRRTERRVPTHAECARRVDHIDEDASRKRLRRASWSWEQLAEGWEAQV